MNAFFLSWMVRSPSATSLRVFCTCRQKSRILLTPVPIRFLVHVFYVFLQMGIVTLTRGLAYVQDLEFVHVTLSYEWCTVRITHICHFSGRTMGSCQSRILAPWIHANFLKTSVVQRFLLTSFYNTFCMSVLYSCPSNPVSSKSTPGKFIQCPSIQTLTCGRYCKKDRFADAEFNTRFTSVYYKYLCKLNWASTSINREQCKPC